MTDYAKANYASLHSLLNYALISAGIQNDYFAVPEYKLRLKIPLKTPRGRNQYFIQVDTAFFIGASLKGIGEVFTLDEIHGCIPSGDFSEQWQTPYKRLNHAAQYFPGIFFIVVNVIPSQGKMPAWKGIKDCSLGQRRQGWAQLIKDLRAKGSIAHHIVIDETKALSHTY